MNSSSATCCSCAIVRKKIDRKVRQMDRRDVKEGGKDSGGNDKQGETKERPREDRPQRDGE